MAGDDPKRGIPGSADPLRRRDSPGARPCVAGWIRAGRSVLRERHEASSQLLHGCHAYRARCLRPRDRHLRDPHRARVRFDRPKGLRECRPHLVRDLRRQEGASSSVPAKGHRPGREAAGAGARPRRTDRAMVPRIRSVRAVPHRPRARRARAEHPRIDRLRRRVSRRGAQGLGRRRSRGRRGRRGVSRVVAIC